MKLTPLSPCPIWKVLHRANKQAKQSKAKQSKAKQSKAEHGRMNLRKDGLDEESRMSG